MPVFDLSRCPVKGCETIILGGTESDWREHFEDECNPFGVLYEPKPWETNDITATENNP